MNIFLPFIQSINPHKEPPFVVRYFKSLMMCLLMPILANFAVKAQHYYVAKDGADDNNGAVETPFLTIGKAVSVLQPGDTCFIKEGVYRETVNASVNGTASNPIVITNFGSDSVVVVATEEVNDWIHYKESVYKAKVAMPLTQKNMVYCNSKIMDIARWPNNEDNDLYTIDTENVSDGTASSLVSESSIPAYNWTSGYVWYLGAHSGTSWTREITSINGNEVVFPQVDVTKWPFNAHNPSAVRNNNMGRFYLFGVIDALDHEREWFFDATEDSLYFQAPGNVDPSTLGVEATFRERTLNIAGDYLVFDGIDAFGGKIQISGDNCIIKNGHFLNCLQILDELDNTGAQAWTGAIHVGGSNAIIEHNVLDGSSINGVFIQGWGNVTNAMIRHNQIYNCNTVGIHSSPIRSAGEGHKFISNTIKSTGRDGIYTNGTNNEIAYNDVSYCMLINNDGGVYYTVGNESLKNVEIHHNWFHDSEGPDYADGRAAGVYLDNNSKGYNVHHNVIWNVTWSGLQANWNNTNIDFFNNSLIDCGQATGRWANGYVENNNRLYNNYSTIGEWSSDDFQPELKTNLIASTELQDVDNHDFMPLETSALVDAGTNIVGITDNAVGGGVDIGAYERGRTPWIPGINTDLGNLIDSSSIVLSISYAKELENDILVYPNPLLANELKIEFKNTTNRIEMLIFDSSGKAIYESVIHGHTISLPKRLFGKPGMYVAHFNLNNRQLIQKLIVE